MRGEASIRVPSPAYPRPLLMPFAGCSGSRRAGRAVMRRRSRRHKGHRERLAAFLANSAPARSRQSCWSGSPQ